MSKIPAAVAWEPVVERRVRGEPAFAEGLLEEAVQALIDNDISLARNLMRHVIKGTIGYRDLSDETGFPEKSLIRMFGPAGNPTAKNLFAVVDCVRRRTKIELTVRAVRGAGAKRGPRKAARRAA